MSEIIQNAGEVLPLATAAAGYGAGLIAEKRALASQAMNRVGLMRAHQGTEATINSHRSLPQRFLSHLAIVGALAGFAAGEAVVTHDTLSLDAPALTEAVDHTFGTGLSGDGTDKLIGRIASGVAGSKDMHVQIVVAHDGTVEPISASRVKTDIGYGAQNLPAATTAAIDNAYSNSTTAETNTLGAKSSRNGGVLLVTDGDSVGAPKVVINYAKEHGDMPIFAVNVGPDKDQTAQNLRKITHDTSGRYWHVSKKASADTIARTIQKDIVPKAVEHKSHTGRLPWSIVALSLTGLGAAMYRKRSREWERQPKKTLETTES